MSKSEKAADAGDSKPVQRITVVLNKPHTHRGILHPAGAKVDLRPDQVERLRRDGVVA